MATIKVGALAKRAKGLREAPAFQLLADLNFRRLVAGVALGLAAFNFNLMAQSWFVLELTDSKLWVGLVAGASTVTVMAFSLVAGPLADRMDRKLLILISRIAQGVVAFTLAFVVTSGWVAIWHIVALSIAGGLALAIMGPAGETLLMDIAGRERLLTASAVQSLVMSLARFGAPAAAGVMIAALGVEAAFYSAAAILLLASVLIAMIRLPKIERPRAEPMLTALLDGLRYVTRTPHVAWLIFVSSLAIIAGIYLPLVPVYARDVLIVGARGFGLLEASWGLGTLVGAVWLLSLGDVRRKGRMVIIVAVSFGASMIVFGLSRSFYLSLAMMFVLGLSPPFWLAGIRTILQTTIPDEMRGRVMAVFLLGMQGFGLGWPLGGALAETFGNEAAIAAAGLLFILLNLWAMSGPRRCETPDVFPVDGRGPRGAGDPGNECLPLKGDLVLRAQLGSAARKGCETALRYDTDLDDSRVGWTNGF